MSNLIAIDWGTSAFRAYLLDGRGNIVQKVFSPRGILTVENGTFAQVLDTQLKEFPRLSRNTPIIAAGMITSKNGWCETPYLTCPVDSKDLGENLIPFETEEYGTIWFVPGVNQLVPEPDIMRGEESQLAGIRSEEDVVAVMPGTHSKWVKVSDQAIRRFKTYMTGEFYSLVIKHSILKPASEALWSEEAFRKGVLYGFSMADKGNGLLSGIFQVRVEVILGRQPEKNTSSYVSGLLVGYEIADAVRSGFHTAEKKLIIGDGYLSTLYQLALSECGIGSEIAVEDLSAHGLYRIAKHTVL